MSDAWEVLRGDCVERMRELADASVDAVVCDPPYGLGTEPDAAEVLRHWLAGDDYVHRGGGFMGKSWDSFVPGPAVWREALRVLKPGGHLLAFFGTRTVDLGGMAIRLAGFEVRDTLAWMYGSGFPKSLDVSKAIDKAAGVEREETGRVLSVTGNRAQPSSAMVQSGLGAVDAGPQEHRETRPATPEAQRWAGWGTALKPAFEPIVVARKPVAGTVAGNVLAHGTGALNVDATRIPGDVPQTTHGVSGRQGEVYGHFRDEPEPSIVNPGGRWPANVLLDEDAAAVLDEQTGTLTSGKMHPTHTTAAVDGRGVYGADAAGGFTTMETYGDSGGASRFFYVAKASSAERNAGLDGFEAKAPPTWPNGEANPGSFQEGQTAARANVHPTVKPIDVMRWLVRLVTPPGGTVLDPFTGSGTTGCAATLEGFRFVGIERDEEYAAIADARIRFWAAQPQGTDVDVAIAGEAKRQKVAETGQVSLLDIL